jgi:hypothetical protein
MVRNPVKCRHDGVAVIARPKAEAIQVKPLMLLMDRHGGQRRLAMTLRNYLTESACSGA